MSLTVYKNWLKKQKYTDSTIEASLKVLRRLDAKKPEPVETDVFLLRRYLRCVKETREHPLGPAFTKKLKKLGIKPAVARANSGKRSRKLLSSDEFYALQDCFLKKNDNVSHVLALYMSADKRPKEFLHMSASEARRSNFFVVTNSAKLPTIHWFEKLEDETLLYETISSSYSWAYRKILAELKKTARSMDIDADLNTLHRSRFELL